MQLQGLRLDSKFADSAAMSWAYAKNVLLSRGFDEIENEPGDTLIDSSITGSIKGRITTPNDIILFTIDGTTVLIRHLSSTGTLTTLLTTTTSFYDISGTTIYIEGVHCYNNEGDLIVAWTDGTNKPMILNVTHALVTPITIDEEPELKNYYLFPEFNHNNFTLPSTSIVNGGRLPAAAYFVSIAYELEPDVDTNFGGISNPIFITEDDALTTYKQFRGNGTLVITNKGFIVNVSVPDITYNFFKLVIIQKTETGTQCWITKRIKNTYTVALPTINVFIDDLDKLTPFNLTEVVTSSPAFNTVKSITQSNKKLRLFGLTKPQKLSLATIYNEVLPAFDINWITDTEVALNNTKGSYKDSVFIFDKRGFRSDEVYALYAGLKLKTGGYYGIYHLPGRAEIGNEHAAVLIGGVNYDTYKIGSTALKDAGGYYGKMGFWENENEVYPTGYGTISGAKVRHHRFPSAGQIAGWKSGILHRVADKFLSGHTMVMSPPETATITWSFNGINSVTPYSEFHFDSTVAENGKFVALSNFRAVLNFDISAIVDEYTEGTLQYGSLNILIEHGVKQLNGSFVVTPLYTANPVATTSPGTVTGTYDATIDMQQGDYINFVISAKSTTRPDVTFGSEINIYSQKISQDILGLRISLDWASVISSHAATAASLASVVDGWEIFYAKRTLTNQLMIDQSIVTIDSTGIEGPGYRFYGFDSMANLLNIEPTHVKAELKLESTDYNASTYVNEVINYTPQTVEYAALTKIKYLPAYNSASIPDNTNKENCYFFQTSGGTFNLRLVNFINIKDDVYLDFTNQELISTGVVKLLVATSAFSLYGGDSFIGHNSVLTFPTGVNTAPKIWYFTVESILNSGMRYEGDNDYEKFYPLTDITKLNESTAIQDYIVAMIAAGVANYYFYNNDYHLLNAFRQDNIDNELTSVLNSYPNRIQSSMPQPLESSSVYWRKFKILDYFDMVNNKGAIFKAIGNENIVYIQTQYSIFRGIIVDKLITGDIDVALKSSEMFDRPLEELLDADGTFIRPWNREGMILTPFGLCIADLDKGSIFVISDKANEISKLGIEDWFRKVVTSTITIAEFGTKETVGKGVILGYDDIYKRLLVTIKSTSSNIANFTLSFQFEKMLWACFHRYTPDRYIWNANGLYRIDGISVTKMLNVGSGYSLTITSISKTSTLVTVTTTGSHNLKTGDTILVSSADIVACNGLFLITVTGLTTFTFTVLASTTGTVSNAVIIASDPSVIDFIFNSNKSERFLVNNIKWTTNIEASGINYWDETISRLLLYSKNLCSELITIAKRSYGYNAITYAMEETGNTAFKDGEWVYDDIKDYLSDPKLAVLDNNFKLVDASLNLSKVWSDKSKFISKFIIVRMIYNNSNTTKKLRISNVNIEAKNIL